MRTVVIGLLALGVGGCASTERQIPAGSVVIADTTGGKGPDVYAVCDDKGNLVYLTKDKKGPVYAIQGGCKKPVETPAVAASTPWPQPFQVQLIPPPGAPAVAAQLPAEPREPIVVRVEPAPACPVCAPAPAAAAPSATRSVWPVDPNVAAAEGLERLPGVTAKMAHAIIRGRPYRTLQDLVAKGVLSEADLTALSPYLIIR